MRETEKDFAENSEVALRHFSKFSGLEVIVTP